MFCTAGNEPLTVSSVQPCAGDVICIESHGDIILVPVELTSFRLQRVKKNEEEVPLPEIGFKAFMQGTAK